MFIYGADTFSSRRYLRQAVAQFKKQRDPAGYNVTVLDGATPTPEILAAFQAAPFLAEKRLVVVENFLSQGEAAALKAIGAWVEAKNFPSHLAVIFWQGELVGKTAAAKELEGLLRPTKFAREFKTPTAAEARRLAVELAAEAGATVEPAAAAYLAEQAEGDPWELFNAVRQLAAAAATEAAEKSTITLAAARALVVPRLDDNVFSAVEAVARGDAKSALALLNYQRARGEEDEKIFGLLVWQFRVLLALSDALERAPDLTSEQAARQLKLHPFVVKKNWALARRLPLAVLERAYRRLHDIDLMVKRGVAPLPLLLDWFSAA